MFIMIASPAGMMADVVPGAMGLGIIAAQAAGGKVHTVAAATGAIPLRQAIPFDFFGDSGGVFVKHPSDLFKGTALKELLFDVGAV